MLTHVQFHFHPASARLLSASARPPPVPLPPSSRRRCHPRHPVACTPTVAAAHSLAHPPRHLPAARRSRHRSRSSTHHHHVGHLLAPTATGRLPAHPPPPLALSSEEPPLLTLVLIHASCPPLGGGADLLFHSRAADRLRPCARPERR
jgi:hypothetical protein